MRHPSRRDNGRRLEGESDNRATRWRSHDPGFEGDSAQHIDGFWSYWSGIRSQEPEVIGITHENLEPDSPRGENWGYLVREVTPYPCSPADVRLVPGFALYGADRFDPGARPLLLEMIADDDRVHAVLETILFPVIRHWIRLFLTLGFILEPHGQNALLEVNGQGRIVRIVHRDLSLGIDMRRRRDLGLSDAGLNRYNQMESGGFASIAYDKFMGGHFFERIVGTLERDDPGVRPEPSTERAGKSSADSFRSTGSTSPAPCGTSVKSETNLASRASWTRVRRPCGDPRDLPTPSDLVRVGQLRSRLPPASLPANRWRGQGFESRWGHHLGFRAFLSL